MLAKIQLVSLLAASLVASTPTPDAPGAPCEPLERICYGHNVGTSQNLDEEDIKQAAAYLRDHGRKKKALYNMPSGFICEESTIVTSDPRTVLVLAKHVNPRTNSSVSLEDIANTIDGGEDASEVDKANSLLGCGVNGGSLGVKVDPKSPLYNTTEYKNGNEKPQDIIIKLIQHPSFRPEIN